MMLSNDEFQMNQESNRISTFSDWPYDNNSCLCSSKKMAEAGFFHIPSENEPDLVKCFACFKELDGWEPEDDPWSEHKIHSPKCILVKINKKEADWTIEDMLKIEVKRQEARAEKICQKQIDQFREEASKVREKLSDM